jgi:hypothetical protein
MCIVSIESHFLIDGGRRLVEALPHMSRFAAAAALPVVRGPGGLELARPDAEPARL